MDGAKLQDAIAFAKQSEVRAPRDLEQAHYQTFGREPFGDAVGPFRPRGEASGVIVRRGYIVAEWGEPARVDMTFSVTKSFVSTTVGLAVERGLIRSIDDPVHAAMGPVLHATMPALATEGGRGQFNARIPIAPFDTPHNRRITWKHLLQQNSDWEGTLWGKPEWADRPSNTPATWWTRERATPGTVYEYNDTRVNALALAALNVWRRPLPEVLRELVMDPIGASPDWEWHGYRNSYVEIDGRRMQSVSGGSHWGGGVFIHAQDQARIGLLLLRGGVWNGRRILSQEWISRMRVPCPLNPQYGYLWWLNTGRAMYPSASERSYTASGAGGNLTWIDPDNDLVAVMRWIDPAARDGFMGRVTTAVRA